MKNRKIVLAGLAALVALLVLAGCEQANPPTAISTSDMQVQSRQGVVSNLLAPIVNLIPLPRGDGKNTVVSKSALVTPWSNTTITLESSYRTVLGTTCTRSLSFTVPAGAVDRPLVVTATLDTADAGVNFKPEGLVFRTPARLDFKVSSLLSLTWLTAFYYVSDDGNFERISCANLTVVPVLGIVDMKGAAIAHFSRYAFGR
ncbi:MAG TPA: hypothetical protein VLY03_05045 [Bacteroidota bacterium]|nr:hypothetical protein [Bacteroidota bacterium]